MERERRTAIMDQIKTSSAPVPGKALAAQYEVSRQVIVQDIALIRAAGHNIISTNRGYILHESHLVEKKNLQSETYRLTRLKMNSIQSSIWAEEFVM